MTYHDSHRLSLNHHERRFLWLLVAINTEIHTGHGAEKYCGIFKPNETNCVVLYFQGSGIITEVGMERV